MTAHRRPTDRTEDRRAIRYEDLELTVPPEPVQRMRPGDPDPDAAERRTYAVVGLLLLGVLIVLATLFALAVITAPREAADPTTEATRDVSGLRDGASGPPLLGASRATSDGGTTTALGGAPLEGGIGTALVGGTATWYCSSTSPCTRYCSSTSPCTRGYGPSDMVAAIDPTLGIAKGDQVTVRHDGRTITVRIVDVCACAGERLIDLTSGAFARLAPLSRGVIDVTIEAGGPALTLPPTDVAP
jgi:hypothetical protein